MKFASLLVLASVAFGTHAQAQQHDAFARTQEFGSRGLVNFPTPYFFRQLRLGCEFYAGQEVHVCAKMVEGIWTLSSIIIGEMRLQASLEERRERKQADFISRLVDKNTAKLRLASKELLSTYPQVVRFLSFQPWEYRSS